MRLSVSWLYLNKLQNYNRNQGCLNRVKLGCVVTIVKYLASVASDISTKNIHLE